MKRFRFVCASFCLLLFCLQVNAQSINAGGVIIDSKGDPVIGATVLELGVQGNGTVSDFDGRFTLTTRRGAKLQISFVGYKTQEVAAGSNLKITLYDDTETLSEVVVIGYGTARKKDFMMIRKR